MRLTTEADVAYIDCVSPQVAHALKKPSSVPYAIEGLDSIQFLHEAIEAADRDVANPLVAEKAKSYLSPVNGFQARAVHSALALLAGEDPVKHIAARSGLPVHPIDRACEAWTSYVIGNEGLAQRCRQLVLREVERPREDAVQAMALRNWVHAMESLAYNDVYNARRLWQRALEIGGTFGTPSHYLVSWTYAAAFRPRG
jgi:hypothetical protein